MFPCSKILLYFSIVSLKYPNILQGFCPPSHLSLSLLSPLLIPAQLSCSSSNSLSSYHPHGLCTCCSLYLGHSCHNFCMVHFLQDSNLCSNVISLGRPCIRKLLTSSPSLCLPTLLYFLQCFLLSEIMISLLTFILSPQYNASPTRVGFYLSYSPLYLSTKNSPWHILGAQQMFVEWTNGCSPRKQHGELTLLIGHHQGSSQTALPYWTPELCHCWLYVGQWIPQRKRKNDSFSRIPTQFVS